MVLQSVHDILRVLDKTYFTGYNNIEYLQFVVLYSKLISRPMSHNYYGEVKSNIYHMVHSELKC
jgi:hypothetical protein